MRRAPPTLPVVLLAALVLPGCAKRGAAPEWRAATTAPAAPWFVERAAAAGLDAVNDPGPEGSFFMPQSMGNGAALIDFDQDGRLDLYLASVSATLASDDLSFHQKLKALLFEDLLE